MKGIAFILLGVLILGFVSAQGAVFVNQVTPDFNQYYSSENRLGIYYPIFGQQDELCRNRQDLIIQVAPVGCQPAVVRSDLLAEQNVPVFCQLQAIQANPLVDIKQIRNIRFTGKYPAEVVGTGFHPAQAALRTTNVLLGNPVLNDIGYVVVVLKKNPVESELPKFVNLTLTANLDYYAENAFGIGSSEFLLQVLDDGEWQSSRNRQSFLNGEYFFRLDEATPEYAIVSVYHQDRKVQSVRVDRTKNSDKIYLPGLYCGGEITLSYSGFATPEVTAKLRVGEDNIEVYQGSSFLNGKCRVTKIDYKNENDGKIDLSCGTGRVSLSITPESLEVGDLVRFRTDEIGGDVWEVKAIKDGRIDIQKLSVPTEAKEGVISGELIPIEDDKLWEAVYDSGIEANIKNSLDSYESIVDSYSAEKDNSDFYGVKALERAIDFAGGVNKEQTQVRLINLLLEQYPEINSYSKYSDLLTRIYSINSDKASVVLDIDNDYKTIKLLNFVLPQKKSKANLAWGAESAEIQQGNFLDLILGKLSVNRIDRNGISVSAVCKDNNLKGGSFNLKVDEVKADVCGRDLFITSLDVQDFARIKVEPASRTSGQTNVSVNIGIEKRAIKLSPDKTKEKIENLNKSIEKWEGISNGLGDAVKGLKAACFATSGVLTVKNFLTGLSGEAAARQKVMRDEGGWTDRCTSAFQSGRVIEGDSNNNPYASLDDCFRRNSRQISSDVGSMTDALNQVNDRVKQTQQGYVKPTGIFGETITVDTDGLKDKNIKYLQSTYGSSDIKVKSSSNDDLDLGDVVNGIKGVDSVSLQQTSDIELYTKLIENPSVPAEQKESYKQRLGFILDDINQVNKVDNERSDFEDKSGLRIFVPSYSNAGQYLGDSYKQSDSKISLGTGVVIDEGTPIQTVQGKDGKQYLYVLKELENENGQKTYSVDGDKIYELTSSYDGKYTANALTDEVGKVIKKAGGYSVFRSSSSASYNYPFAKGEGVVEYYEREPYKGMPAMVPIDLETGFYAATEQTLPGFGNIKAFEASGNIVSFYVCNVMEDGRVGFFSPGFGGDECMRVDLTTGQPLDVFPGLSSEAAKKLVEKAKSALTEAARQYPKKQVTVLGKVFDTGLPAVSSPSVQCQDFMSPDDCQILFNVCDPVICPSSRCDFGGTYPVDNVIQSGIVGSALLCLPNIKEGIAVPVCLTGIKAGTDNYLSILKSHRACLEENLASGNNVGICDLITSVYTCEFFWRQAAPLANVLLPKIVEYAYTGGQGQVRGGGEYLTVQSAWDNTQNSIDYFTNYYADDSFKAFNIRSIEEAGTPFCRAFVSAKSPTSFKTLIEPDSPVQFSAWFSEIPFSDATVPATSQYKVFYHIFAGNDAGTVYSVYLKEPPESSYYRSTPQIRVASNFVARGQAVSETKDFTAPAGYKQLCVRVNDQEECGFKQVTTSFALDYVKDKVVADEIAREGIRTEAECISGSVNPAAFLNPNIEEAAQEAIDPAVYKRGIVRICATDNPGRSTSPGRFKEVGICGNDKLKCWLDSESVSNALSASIPNVQGSILNDTLENLGSESVEVLKKNGFVLNAEALEGINSISSRIDTLVGKDGNLKSTAPEGVNLLVLEIDKLLNNLFFDRDKAALLYQKGRLYEGVARILIGARVKVKPAGEAVAPESPVTGNDAASSGGIADPELTNPPQDSVLPISQRFSVEKSNGGFRILYRSSEKVIPDPTGVYVNKNERNVFLLNPITTSYSLVGRLDKPFSTENSASVSVSLGILENKKSECAFGNLRLEVLDGAVISHSGNGNDLKIIITSSGKARELECADGNEGVSTNNDLSLKPVTIEGENVQQVYILSDRTYLPFYLRGQILYADICGPNNKPIGILENTRIIVNLQDVEKIVSNPPESEPCNSDEVPANELPALAASVDGKVVSSENEKVSVSEFLKNKLPDKPLQVNVDYGFWQTSIDYRFNRREGQWEYQRLALWASVDRAAGITKEQYQITQDLRNLNEIEGYLYFNLLSGLLSHTEEGTIDMGRVNQVYGNDLNLAVLKYYFQKGRFHAYN